MSEKKAKKFKPALACDMPVGLPDGTYCVLPKIDGVRGLAGDDGVIVGRSLKMFRNEEAIGSLYFSSDDLAGLDGELTHGDTNVSPRLCSETTSWLNRNPDPTDNLHWWVFDDHSYDGPYLERWRSAKRRVEAMGHPRIHIVPMYIVLTYTNVLKLHTKFMAQGFEGSIVRRSDGEYKYGRTTAKEGTYMRIKDFVETEAVVASLEEGQSNQNEAETNLLGHTERSTKADGMVLNGTVGALNVLHPELGPVTVGPGCMTHKERGYYWQNQHELIGQTIKFKYFPHGMKDKPRFPTFVSIRCAEDMS